MENFLNIFIEDWEDAVTAHNILTACHKTDTCHFTAQMMGGMFAPTPRLANVQRHMKYQIAWYNICSGRLL